MARLQDLPRVLRTVGPWSFGKRVVKEIVDDKIVIWASALAYAWLFAVFPFFIFLLSVLPLLPEWIKGAAIQPLHQAVYVLPDRAAGTLWTSVEQVMSRPHNGLLSLGFIITVWAASGGMNMTIAAIDRCYDLTKDRPYYRQRLLAIGLMLIGAVIILAVVVVIPLMVEHQLASFPPWTHWIVFVVHYLLAVLLLFMLVAVVYYFGPAIKQEFHIVTPGSVFTVAVWVLLEVLFRFYVNRFGKYEQTYGAVGGVAIMLLFFYIDALVLLIGAEINSEVDFAKGIPRGTTDFRESATLLFQEPESSEDEETVGSEPSSGGRKRKRRRGLSD
jgi:membrane protein